MALILTITPNAALDKTYVVSGFNLNAIFRPSETRTTAGGKGINVSRVLSTLGRDSLATGFIGGRVGQAILDTVSSEGLMHDFIEVQDESRLCIAVVDPDKKNQTEVNEVGPVITESELAAFFSKLGSLVKGSEFVVMSGSCPPGVPITFYGDIIKVAESAGVRCLLDTSGKHLIESVKASPYMVKPNTLELSQLVGYELYTMQEILRAALETVQRFGVKIIAVTMGKSGAIVTDGKTAWQAASPKIEFASAVGSGDSFAAAFLDCHLNGGSLPDALARGIGAGSANAASYSAGFCSKESIDALSSEVECVSLDI